MHFVIETTESGDKALLGTGWASSYPANKDADRAKLQGKAVEVLSFPSNLQAVEYIAQQNARNRRAA